MRILLTNDDGITAPGIAALYDALQGLGEIRVVAPADMQSASSHGITFHHPLMVSEVQANPRMRGVAVEGRPADCVKLAARCLWQEWYGVGARPDLVVSGMNAGANVGINVIYSGTVGAAVEGAFLGIPSIVWSVLRILVSASRWYLFLCSPAFFLRSIASFGKSASALPRVS